MTKCNTFILFFLMLWLVSCKSIGYAQSKDQQFKAVSIGFYNLENLYDTDNDPLIDDEEFLPQGAKSWSEDRYKEKLSNMAFAISQIGVKEVSVGLSILGVCEIENRKVLEDLVEQPQLKHRNYQIVHYDSPDGRGVDVGMLYNPMHFIPLHHEPIKLDLSLEGSSRKTRDILYVKGILDGDTVHIMVNHWPSKGGGPATDKYRNKAAKVVRGVTDSLLLVNEDAKIFIMGDLNTDPREEAMKSFLRTVSKSSDVHKTGLFNPFEDIHRRGGGTHGYRDAWGLFDQIVISKGVIEPRINQNSYKYLKAMIFNKAFLVQQTGQYKGYPKRTFSGDQYLGGYSDHFPVYVILVKEI